MIWSAASGGKGSGQRSRERQTGPLTATDPKADLHFYLQSARDALLWKLEGLSEYDIRRPLTPTGTNLLGLDKHVTCAEMGYLGDTFGRPSGEPGPWFGDGAEPNAHMWATADESRERIGGAQPGSFGVGACPVPADDLHAGMSGQPGGQRPGFACR